MFPSGENTSVQVLNFQEQLERDFAILKSDVVDRLSFLYISSRNKYLISLRKVGLFVVKKKGATGTVPATLTDKAVFGHVNRRYALGVFAGESGSKFICFDVDLKEKDVVQSVINSLVGFGIPRKHIYVSTSGGKGYHVEVFFDTIVNTCSLKRLYRAVIQHTGLNPKKVEFRPTYTQGIKLPLSVHYKTGNIAWYLDNNFEEIKCLDYIFDIKQYSAEEFYKLDLPTVTTEEYKACRHASNAEIALDSYDGVGMPPPMTEPGTRHNMMVRIAIKCHAGTAEKCERLLYTWYTQQDPKLIGTDESDIVLDIKEIAAWAQANGLLSIKTKPCITQEDVLRVLAQKTKLSRKIMFYMLVRINDSPWRTKKESIRGIAQFTGASINGVQACVSDMLANGDIHRSDKKRRIYWRGTPTGNHVEVEAHSYYVKEDYKPCEKLLNLKPREGGQGHDMPYVTVNYKQLLEDFDKVFYGTLLKFHKAKDLKDYLSATEYRLIRQRNYEGDIEGC